MGEYIFSIFIGGYFAAVGIFMNWHLKKEMKALEAEQKLESSREGVS